jgi:FemAB-related protein (PEP-CTERM system-associated)
MIRKLDQDLHERWDDYVLTSLHGTFFHTLGWKRVMETTFGYTPHYLVKMVNGEVKGCLPLFHIRIWPFKNALISVPFGVAGGVCADDTAVGSALVDEACRLTTEIKADYMELRHTLPTQIPLQEQDLYYTFEREILDDPEKNMAAIPRKQRRMIREGIKAGLTSTVGCSEEDLEGLYRIYSHSVRNLGTPVFPLKYFKRLVAEFPQSTVILSVWYEGIRVAAVMAFLHKSRIMPYYGGGLREYQQYAINDFMYWELMRYGCERGFTIFDFGRSKRGTGAFDFKRHWGFEPRPLPYQYFLPRGGMIPNVNPLNPRFQFFIKLWRNLPLPVAESLGPLLIKFFP